ncbi:MAG: glutamate 5-kinase [Bdellovibrionota bacterium]
MQHFVLKLGTRVVSDASGKLEEQRLGALVKSCALLWKQKKRFAIVSSGAIGLGQQMLKLKGSLSLSDKQASAAVGQSLLMRYYTDAFAKYGVHVAQVLVTAEDFSKRENFENLKRTLERLFELSVIPILNENDCVATREISSDSGKKSFGDNDALSAIVASKLGAELLILLTDVDGVYSENPQKNSKAKKINKISTLQEIDEVQTQGKSLKGRGGMQTKLQAAKMASISGCTTVIASGFEKGVLEAIFSDKQPGTWVLPSTKLNLKKHWIGAVSGFKGVLILNEGAATALLAKHASLLAVGIVSLKGNFQAGDVVSIQNERGDELGRGLSFYSSADVLKMQGKRSADLKKSMGAEYSREIVHRDNLVLFL